MTAWWRTYWPLDWFWTVVLAVLVALWLYGAAHTPSGTHRPDTFADGRSDHRSRPPRVIRDRHTARRRRT